jgi:hypothetical protein
MLFMLVDAAAHATDTTMAIRLIAWIEARSDDEFGFLWLAGQLGYRPSQLDAILRNAMTASRRRRQSISRAMSTIFWNALNG